jgi:chromosomal replication initiator protein
MEKELCEEIREILLEENGVGIKEKKYSIEDIEKIVCNYFNITKEKLHEPLRNREIVEPRQIAMNLAKNWTKCSLATIGTKIGGKDHATVLHACKTVNNLMETDKVFKYQFEEIENRLIEK